MSCSAFKAMSIWRNIRFYSVQTFIFAESGPHCAFFQQVTHIHPAGGASL